MKIAQHMIPQNYDALQVKTISKEIWNTLKGQHKKIDMSLTTLQKNISTATVAIAKAADALTKRA